MVLLVLLLAGSSKSDPLAITDVSHAPAVLDAQSGQSVDVRFRLTSEADVSLRVYDGRDKLVRSIGADSTLSAGEHRLRWDGRDQAGRLVPPEAYVYTLVAKGPGGQLAEHDLTDITGNRPLPVTHGSWEAARGEVGYSIPTAARVNIRAGLGHGGPLLKTVVDWVARPRGAHVEPWDGFDTSNVLDISKHPNLELQVSGWTLPDNAIVVVPAQAQVQLIDDLTWPASSRVVKREPRPDPRALNQIPIEQRRDPRVRLHLPKDLPVGDDALPVVRGSLIIRLDVDDRDRIRMLDQRFEAGFFVDGRFMFENEVGFLPMTWTWDTTTVNEGVHFVTGNVWGYSGQFGSATVRVRVAR